MVNLTEEMKNMLTWIIHRISKKQRNPTIHGNLSNGVEE
jgi:hypothetical protein